MDPRVIGNYGGPKVDATAVSNPETQIASSEYNRALEDMAQLTNTAIRAIVQFQTTIAAAPFTYAAANVNVRTVWGSGTAQKPVVTKTSTGLYSLLFPASFTDALGVVENVAFFDGWTSVRNNSTDDLEARIRTLSGNAVSLFTFSPATDVSDFGNISGTVFNVALWLR